ncbi:hypothetical protein G6F68_012824 [Rhizopus microsporus]|nr:hypothetical protein G6F68_012824 [Rhizopus microsporus]
MPDSARLARLDLVDGAGQRVEVHVHIATQQVGHGLAAALVGNVLHRHAGDLRETRGAQMLRAAHARRGVQQLLGFGAGVIHQVLDGGVAVLGGVYDQHVGHRPDVPHCGEIPDGVDAGLHDIGRGDRGLHVRQQQRVAVGVGFCHVIGGDQARGPRLVLDHDLLAKQGGPARGHDARRDVGAAAGHKPDDQADGAFRPLRRILRQGGAGGGHAGRQGQRARPGASMLVHMESPWWMKPARALLDL